MKKYFLKGKEYLSKKLEELEIETESIDYVSEQIPTRLKAPLQVLLKNIDLQESEKYEMYFKMYPNHHLSEFLLEKYKLLTNADSPTPEIVLPKPPVEGVEQLFVPKYDIELENKALLLKEVVEEYEEGYYKSNEAILCVSVVHFHHKRGAEVEYTYPKNKTTEGIENLIVHHSMPDSSHNKNEDYNFFNFETTVKGKKRMLFGVSYFKQIKVTEEHKSKNQELTRSYMQKAICVIGYLPLFGYLKVRLTSTVKLFFKEFDNFSLIDEAYKDLEKHLVETWPQLSINELYIGSDLRTIINLFKPHDFYEIWKAVLYQKRIVVFAHSSSSASSFILSLLTLFPGMSTFGIYSKEISKYMQGLREYGLPLKMFSNENFMSMSFHIQDFHMLAPFQKSKKGSFLVGTTNRLLKEHNDYGIEMLVNLENCTIEKRKTAYFEGLSKREKGFIEQLEEVMLNEKTFGYSSSEDCVRNLFHGYLKESLTRMMIAVRDFKKFVIDCKEYEKGVSQNSNKTPRKKSLKNIEENGIELNEEDDEEQYSHHSKSADQQQNGNYPPPIPNTVLNMPFSELLLLGSFQFFLQFHNSDMPELIKGQKVPGLLIENYKYYLRINESQFASYNWSDKKLVFGKGTPKNFEGKEYRFFKNYEQLSKSDKLIRDEEIRRVKSVFLGVVEKGKYTKNGFLADKTQIYEGDFYKGMKQGYGKLTNTIHKYIGNFEQDLYSGQGQLVTPKQIYVGEFKEGLRHGCGKNQSHFVGGLNYDGEWVNDRPQGSGIMKNEDKTEIIGMFKSGRIDESQEVSLRYENGRVYKGFIKDEKPHGKGFMIDPEGQVKSGFFEEGKLVKEQIDSNKNYLLEQSQSFQKMAKEEHSAENPPNADNNGIKKDESSTEKTAENKA